MILYNDVWGVPVIAWAFIMAIPLVAIIGGIISGIVRTLGRQKLLEMAQRERIAAIERGIDPSKLPPLPALEDDDELAGGADVYARRQRHRYQGLLIGGIITVAGGLGLGIMLRVLEEDPEWIVGIVPVLVGLALLVSAWLVRPKPENGGARRTGGGQ
jgi:hypothetical protein